MPPFHSVATLFALGALTSSLASAQTREMIEEVQRKLAQKQLEQLQGRWVPFLLMTTTGAEPYPLAGRALHFFDVDHYGRTEGKMGVESGTFKVENGFLQLTVTNHFSWDLEAPKRKTNVRYAFRLEDDLLTLCYSVGNKGKADDLRPGKGRVVVVYKRAKADDPLK